MEVQILDEGPCRKTLKITVPNEKVKEALDAQYAQLEEHVQVSGFRKGRVPRKLLERRFQEEVTEQAKDSLVSMAISESVENNQLKTIGEPEVKEVQFDPEGVMTFEAHLDIIPSFEIADYKGIQVTRPSEEVSEDDIQKEIDRLRERTASLQTVEDGVSQNEDVLIGEGRVECAGETVWTDPAAAIRVGAPGIAQFPVPTLAQSAVGRKAADTIAETLTIPEDFPREELRGKEAALAFQVKEVKRPHYPEITDDWARRIGGNDLADLKDRIRKNLAAAKARDAEMDVERQIQDALLGLANFDLPKRLVELETRRVQAVRRLRLLQMGFPEELVEQEQARLAEGSEEQAVRDCKLFFITDRIAEKERIFATEEEIAQRIESMAARRQTPAAKLRARMEEEGNLSSLRSEMREEKTMEFLKDNAVGARRTNA